MARPKCGIDLVKYVSITHLFTTMLANSHRWVSHIHGEMPPQGTLLGALRDSVFGWHRCFVIAGEIHYRL